ncbi:MAG TPA: VOC family protein [Trueperaceae bacterium]|jgi:predicted 3-demethylubiquinone-9 3-methyltransferase (glyoxalase superfamily)
MSQKVTPFLMFEKGAREAAEFYADVFPDGRVLPGGGAGVTFEVGGQRFHAFDGGSHFRFSDAISLYVSCADQAEVDYYWDRLREGGGEEGRCGWLKDRFGVSWQVVPEALPRLLGDPDPERARRATEAMLGMTKLDVAALEAAADGRAS